MTSAYTADSSNTVCRKNPQWICHLSSRKSIHYPKIRRCKLINNPRIGMSVWMQFLTCSTICLLSANKKPSSSTWQLFSYPCILRCVVLKFLTAMSIATKVSPQQSVIRYATYIGPQDWSMSNLGRDGYTSIVLERVVQQSTVIQVRKYYSKKVWGRYDQFLLAYLST